MHGEDEWGIIRGKEDQLVNFERLIVSAWSNGILKGPTQYAFLKRKKKRKSLIIPFDF